MAFLHTDETEILEKGRFSLLLLEHGEVYFEDISVNLLLSGVSEEESFLRSVRGRLKICSHSLMFEPQDTTQAIIKFPYRKCSLIEQWEVPLTSKAKEGQVLRIVTSEYVKMRENNIIKPYEFVKDKKHREFKFVPNYISLLSVLDKILKLFKAWRSDIQVKKLIADYASLHEKAIEFNSCWIDDLSENIITQAVVNTVLPLVSNRGRALLTDRCLYIQPFNNVDSDPVKKHRLSEMKRAVKRRYMLRNVGLEIFFRKGTCLYLAFDSAPERDSFYSALLVQEAISLDSDDQKNMMLSWQKGTLSNYDYLMYLNSMADRSFNDLTQYPVFPWIIKDYSSKELDLNNPETFRDLSKPIGALNEERLESFRSRFKEMPEPKFLYGSHYSTPGYVLFYTIRVAPEYSLCLQNGKYDHADRLFNEMQETWEGVLTGNADVKELIPEFYNTEYSNFLVKPPHLDFGMTQKGNKINDVILPPWAEDNLDFVQKNREALECDYVSEHIHEWIDLIFGYKQRGQAAIEHNNLFYWLTYEGAVDLDKVHDPVEREAYETQILEFGQTPKQLFTIPHPQRFGTGRNRAGSNNSDGTMGNNVVAGEAEEWEDMAGFSKEPSEADNSWFEISKLKPQWTQRIHREGITDIKLVDGIVYTVSKDCCLKLFSINEQCQTHSVQLGDLTLSSILVMDGSKTVAVGSWDNSVYFYSTEYGRIVDTLHAHDDACSALAMTSDKTLITTSWDTTLKLWQCDAELERGLTTKRAEDRYVEEMCEHDNEIQCVAVNESGDTAVSGDSDGFIVVWDIPSHSIKFKVLAHTDVVNALCFSPDGNRVFSAGHDGIIKVLDLSQKAEVFKIDANDSLHCIATDGYRVVGGGESGCLHVWDAITGKKLLSCNKHKGPITCLAVCDQGRTVVTGSEDRSITLWKAE